MKGLLGAFRGKAASPKGSVAPTDPRRSERGQSLVEIAISLLFLVWLLAAIIDLGSALFTWIELRDAAQEGALYGSLNPSDSTGIQRRVLTASNRPVDLTGAYFATPRLLRITTTPSDTNADSVICTGDAITVALEYDYTPVMAFVGAIWNKITIHATVTDTVLLPACPSP